MSSDLLSFSSISYNFKGTILSDCFMIRLSYYYLKHIMDEAMLNQYGVGLVLVG